MGQVPIAKLGGTGGLEKLYEGTVTFTNVNNVSIDLSNGAIPESSLNDYYFLIIHYQGTVSAASGNERDMGIGPCVTQGTALGTSSNTYVSQYDIRLSAGADKAVNMIHLMRRAGAQGSSAGDWMDMDTIGAGSGKEFYGVHLPEPLKLRVYASHKTICKDDVASGTLQVAIYGMKI